MSSATPKKGVAATRLRPDIDADAAIAGVVRRFGDRRLPAIWYVSDDDQPADLPDRLTRAGCQGERTGVAMGAEVGAVVDAPPPDRVMIRELIAAEELSDWRNVASAVWRPEQAITGDPDDGDAARHAELYASLPLGPRSVWRHWLAYAGQQPVGMVSGAFGQDAVLVEHVGVVPAFRGGGIGAALAVTPVRHARALGLHWAVLGPTPHSAPLYRRLGFTTQRCVPDQQFYLPL